MRQARLLVDVVYDDDQSSIEGLVAALETYFTCSDGMDIRATVQIEKDEPL